MYRNDNYPLVSFHPLTRTPAVTILLMCPQNKYHQRKQGKEKWVQKLLKGRGGIPYHSTILDSEGIKLLYGNTRLEEGKLKEGNCHNLIEEKEIIYKSKKARHNYNMHLFKDYNYLKNSGMDVEDIIIILPDTKRFDYRWRVQFVLNIMVYVTIILIYYKYINCAYSL